MRDEQHLLCVNYTAYLGGSTVVAARSAQWLKSRGYQVIMASPRNAWLEHFCAEHKIPFEAVAIPHLRPYPFPWIDAVWYLRDVILAAWYLRALYLRYRCTRWYHHCLPNLAGIAGALMCGVKPLWHIHEIDIRPAIIFKILKRLAILSRARLIVPSTAVERLFAPHAVTVIPGALSVDYTATTPEDPPRLTRFLAETQGRVLIVWIGGLEPRKGLSEAIAHIHASESVHDRIAFAVIATCSERYFALRNNITATLARTPFPAILVHGENDPRPWMRKAAVVLQTSLLQESFGLTLIESMSFGLVAICTNRGGSVDFIKNGENALVYDPANKRALGDTLLQLLNDPDLMDRLSQNARKTADRFSADSVYPALTELLS